MSSINIHEWKCSHTNPNDKLYPCNMCKQNFNNLRHNVISKNFIRPSNSVLSGLGPSSERITTDLAELRSTEIHNMPGSGSPTLVTPKQYSRSSALLCKYCPKMFHAKSLLERHLLVHNKKKPHTCGFCKKCFSQKINLKHHMMIHTGEKPFACENCGKRFIHKANRNRHMRTHGGEKPYTCEVCQMNFRWKETLISHMLKHTGEKKFHCETCNKSFTFQSSLNRHTKKRIHLKKEQISKSKSNSKFTQEQNMNQHMNMHLKKDNIHNSMSGGNFLATFKHGLTGQRKSNKYCNSDAQNSNITGRLQQNALFHTTMSSPANSNSMFSRHVNRNWNLDELPLDLSKTGMNPSLSENKTNDSQLHNISTQLATASSGIDIKNQPYNLTSNYIPPELSWQSPIDHHMQSPSYDHSYSHGNFQSQSGLSSSNDTSKLDNHFSQLCLVDSGPMKGHHLSQQQHGVKP